MCNCNNILTKPKAFQKNADKHGKDRRKYKGIPLLVQSHCTKPPLKEKQEGLNKEMDFGKFWLQSNNGKEQIGEIKQGIRREQIDAKLQNLFDAYDANKDGCLETSELNTIFKHLANFAGEDKTLDSVENGQINSQLKKINIENADFMGFVKSVSTASADIIETKEKQTPDGGKEVTTTYNDGTIETIAFYSNGDYKWKKTEKKFTETTYEMVYNGQKRQLNESEFKKVLAKIEEKKNAKTQKASLEGKSLKMPASESVSAFANTKEKVEKKEACSPRYIAETLGVNTETDDGKKVVERLSQLPQEALEKLKDGKELKELIASQELEPTFDNISNVLEITEGVTLRNEEEYKAYKAQRQEILTQIKVANFMANVYETIAGYNDQYTGSVGSFGLGLEGIGYVLNKLGLNGENHYQLADSCKEWAKNASELKVLNPQKFKEGFKKIYGEKAKDWGIDYNSDAFKKCFALAESGKAYDEDKKMTEEYKEAILKAMNIVADDPNDSILNQIKNGFGEALIMIATFGWGAETKAGITLAKSTMTTFSKLGVAIASKQAKNKLLQGALRFTGKAVKLVGPALNEGTKMYLYTAAEGTLVNVSNRAIKQDGFDKLLDTQAQVMTNADGSFTFGAFAGVFGSTVTQKVVQRASKVASKVTTALSEKFSKGAVNANEVFATILEKSAPTKIAEAAAFATDVVGFTAFESALSIANTLQREGTLTPEKLADTLMEEFGHQGYSLGQIKVISHLIMMLSGSRSARMQSQKYLQENLPQLKGATLDWVNGGKEGFKINLPDGRRIECKNASEMISSLHLMVRGETALSGKFDKLNEAKAKKHTKDVKNKNKVDLKFESTVTSIKTDNIKNKLFDYLEHKKTNAKDYYKGYYDNMIRTLKAMGDNFDYETFNAHSKEFLSNIDFLIKLDISPSNIIQEGWFSTENGIDAFNYFKRNLSTKNKKNNTRSDFDIAISSFNPNNWQSALKRGFIDASKKFKVPDGVDIYEYVKKINELAEYSDKQLKLISEFKEKGVSYCSENDDINRLFLECGNSKSKDLLKCIEDKIIKSANKDDAKIKSIVDNILLNKEQVSLETLSKFNDIEFATKHYKDIVELYTTISEGANAIEIKEDNNWGHYDDAVDVINNMAENSKLTALLIKLNKSNNFTAEEIYKISLSLNSNSVDFIKNLTSSTGLSSSEIVDIIYKTRFVFIKTTELKQDIELYNFINSFNAKTKNICLKSGLDIDEKIKPLAERFNKKYDTVTVPKEKQHGFVSAFLSNNNPVYNNILKTFDFSKYQNGLPLKYRREDFRQNVEKFLKNLSEQEQNTLLSHFGLKRGSTGFDGIFNNKDFQSDSASPEMLKAAKNIQTEIENFTLHNEITTGNKEIDGLFTSLLQGCPEFATMVGKAQHANHAYSVDIHTLKVLQSAMNDPIYKTLSDADKTVLKLAVLFHDIGKGEGKNEAMHAYISSDYAIAILDKLNLPQDIKDKVVRIVDNHHWFADYNTGKISAIDVAVRCRKEGDFNIYKILAKADLANVNKYFHLNVTGTNNLVNFNAYMDKLMQRINDIRIDLNRTSSPVMASKIIKNGEFFEKKVVTTDDGENITVSVLNYNELPKNTDLSKYGFAAGTTTENATHIVHLTKGEAELETAITLTKNPKKDTNFSASLIRKDGFIKEGSEKRDVTYLGKFGVVFDAQQEFIVDAAKYMLCSGYKKDLKSAILQYKNKSETNQAFVRDVFLKSLKNDNKISLSNQEYAQLSEIIFNKKYTTQYKDVVIGTKKISADAIKQAFQRVNDYLINTGCTNELIILYPKVSALYAKVRKIEDCPSGFIKMANKYNLPIIIMN